MDFSIATLLASFTHDKSIAPKLLEKKLGTVDSKSLRQLQIALDALEKSGLLEKERGRYRRTPDTETIEAKLRCSSKGFCFAIQDDDGAEDVYVRECHLSNAWNGDRVLVRVTREGGRSRRRSPEGEVQLILERANTSVLARIKEVQPGEYRAVPLDDRLLFEMELDADAKYLSDISEHLVSVEVLRYPIGQLPPLGRIVQVLGIDAEAAAAEDIVACKYGLRRTFPSAVLAAADALPMPDRAILNSDLKQRLDVRPLLTFAVVPTTTDKPAWVDSAFTVEMTGNADRLRVGFHRVDLAHYIEPDSTLDREARRRGVAALLGEIILPIFPDAVGQGLGTFDVHSDRLATSLLLTFDLDCNLLEFEVQPSVVRLDVLLSEAEFLELAATEDAGQRRRGAAKQAAELTAAIAPLVNLAENLRSQRYERGSFDLPVWKGVSVLGREGSLGAPIASTPELEAQTLLAELDIIANEAIARHLLALQVPAVYRGQAAPSVPEIQEAIKLAANLDLDLELDCSEGDAIEPDDVQAFLGITEDPQTRKVLTHLLVPTLKSCGYSLMPRPHFSLALDTYTTFNTPTRHYADFLVQRILNLVFEKGRDRRTTRSKEAVNLRHSNCHGEIQWNVLPPDVQSDLEGHLTGLISLLNERERSIQDAEVDMRGLQKTACMKDRIGQVFTGLIVGVQSYGFFVEIEDLQVEGLVHVSSLKDDWYEYRSRQQILIGRKNRRQYRLGSTVEVEVKGVDYYRQQIDLVTVGGGSIAEDEPDFEDNEAEDRFAEDEYDSEE